MSSISSVSSASDPYQTANQSNFSQSIQDFKAIGSALQSGDVSTAQSALATFQQNLPGSSQTSSNQPFGKNAQANTDYQTLTNALKSGNLSTAQQAYTSLQSDLKSAQGTRKGHHHHHHESSTTGSTSSSTTPTSADSSTTEGSLDAVA